MTIKFWSAVAMTAAAAMLLAGCGGETAKKTSAVARNLGSEMTINVEWVSVPDGQFIMGSNMYEAKDEKERKVTIKSGAYEIMKTPVTNGMYKKWLDSLSEEEQAKNMPGEDRLGRDAWKDGWYPAGKADHPVTNVTFMQAKAFADAHGWSIPSSAQWEKAARGDKDNREFPWGGGEISQSKANYNNPRGGTNKVNEYQDGASPFGCLDMAGNVWEWTATSYDQNNKGRELVMAGGSFSSTDAECKVHNRKSERPGVTSAENGFRCVK